MADGTRFVLQGIEEERLGCLLENLRWEIGPYDTMIMTMLYVYMIKIDLNMII